MSEILVKRKNMSKKVSDGEIEKKSLEMFLSDVEDDIKFLAIKLSIVRKANLVEKRDVKRALRARARKKTDNRAITKSKNFSTSLQTDSSQYPYFEERTDIY